MFPWFHYIRVFTPLPVSFLANHATWCQIVKILQDKEIKIEFYQLYFWLLKVQIYSINSAWNPGVFLIKQGTNVCDNSPKFDIKKKISVKVLSPLSCVFKAYRLYICNISSPNPQIHKLRSPPRLRTFINFGRFKIYLLIF